MSKVNEDQIFELISRVSRKPKVEIQEHMSFRGDLKMDSLQSLDLLVLIEEECGVVIEQTEAVRIQTVGQLIDHLK